MVVLREVGLYGVAEKPMTNPLDPAFPCEAAIQEGAEIKMWEGMTKLEYFSAHADGVDDASAKWIAACFGWPEPTYAPGLVKEWFEWWRVAEAEWKVRQARALIDALDRAQRKVKP
jgi:hypothetical protein